VIRTLSVYSLSIENHRESVDIRDKAGPGHACTCIDIVNVVKILKISLRFSYSTVVANPMRLLLIFGCIRKRTLALVIKFCSPSLTIEETEEIPKHPKLSIQRGLYNTKFFRFSNDLHQEAQY
jgi:hypothetical protein